MRGNTSMLVTVLDVDVRACTAKLKLFGNRVLEATIVSEDLAERLASKLLGTIVVHASVIWEYNTLEVASAVVTGIGAYSLEGANPSAALVRLRELSGGHWDAIDVGAFIAEQRGE